MDADFLTRAPTFARGEGPAIRSWLDDDPQRVQPDDSEVSLPLFIVLTLVSVGGWLYFQRMNEIFCLSWRDGRLLVVRGRAPATLQGDFREALQHSGSTSATIRAVRAQGRASLKTRGIDERGAQRLRNIFGTYNLGHVNK